LRACNPGPTAFFGRRCTRKRSGRNMS
jgi:hypothetical protein